jgi:hypothetical protein
MNCSYSRATGYADKLAAERKNDPLFGSLRDAQGNDMVGHRLAFLIAANIENQVLDAQGIAFKAKKLGEVRDRVLNVYGLAKGICIRFPSWSCRPVWTVGREGRTGISNG